jgi:hypothetical protein
MTNHGDTSIPGYAHPKCFARALCECSAKTNDEHYVSDTALTKISRGKSTIFVQNLGFQDRNVIEEKGIASLTSRILCKFHNNRLSKYDAEGGKLALAMDQIDEHAGLNGWPIDAHFVNGDLIERWMLKTLCGGIYSGNFLVPPEDSLRGTVPPPEWLHILWKDAELPAKHGLYLKAPMQAGVMTTSKTQLGYLPLFSLDASIAGLRMWLFGFEFTLLMADVQPGQKTEFDESLYRPEGLLIEKCSKQLVFRWKDGHQSEPLMMKFLSRTWVHEGPPDPQGKAG